MMGKQVLSVYRKILKVAEKMPTEERRSWVKLTARRKFKESKEMKDEQEIDFNLQLAGKYCFITIILRGWNL